MLETTRLFIELFINNLFPSNLHISFYCFLAEHRLEKNSVQLDSVTLYMTGFLLRMLIRLFIFYPIYLSFVMEETIICENNSSK